MDEKFTAFKNHIRSMDSLKDLDDDTLLKIFDLDITIKDGLCLMLDTYYSFMIKYMEEERI